MSTTLTKRHQTLWLEDGNVILSMEDLLFKVHRSVLGRLSPFFIEQFEQGKHGSFDGLPLIQLEVGIASGSDVEALLQHLYHDKPLNSTSSFDQTARVLRACTQLQFTQVQKLALDRLGNLYPHQPRAFECADWQHVPEATQLALDCGARDALPALLYAMVTTSDFELEDFSTEHAPASVSQNKSYRQSSHRLCVQLMNRIMDYFAPILFTVPTSSHMGCTGVFADHWMNFVIQPALDNSGVYKPLETLKEIQEVKWSSLGLCDACCAEKQKEWEDQAEDIWSRMDSWVNLDKILK